MKRVYFADNLMDAQLVADTLASLGITNHIFNANAVGAMGELPYSQTNPEVWIEDQSQFMRAIDIITARSAPIFGSDKICPHCGEHNPANFLSCWQCESALTA